MNTDKSRSTENSTFCISPQINTEGVTIKSVDSKPPDKNPLPKHPEKVGKTSSKTKSKDSDLIIVRQNSHTKNSRSPLS